MLASGGAGAKEAICFSSGLTLGTPYPFDSEGFRAAHEIARRLRSSRSTRGAFALPYPQQADANWNAARDAALSLHQRDVALLILLPQPPTASLYSRCSHHEQSRYPV